MAVATISIILSIISLIVAGTSLYFAHLRGPILELAIASNPYKTKNISRHGEKYRVDVRVLIANRGNSPGYLYSIDCKGKVFIDVVNFDIDLSNRMPSIIDSGEDFPIKLELWMHKKEVDSSSELPSVEVSYLVSASLGRKELKKEIVQLDLK